MKVPPHNLEAEEAILGAILIDNDVLTKVSGSLKSQYFYMDNHRKIYDSMIELAANGTAIDALTLGTLLKNKKQLKAVGGAIKISELTDSCATTVNANHYADIIRTTAVTRNIINASRKIAEMGFDSEDLNKYSSESAKLFSDAFNGISVGKEPQHIDDVVFQAIKELENPDEDPEGLVKTGIGVIDQVTGGLWPGLLTVLAGRPGMGKSAFLLNVATNVALSGKKVLLITMEDTRKFVVLRLLSRYANIDLTDLTLRRVKYEDWGRIIEAANTITGKKPIWVEDSSGLTSDAIRQIVMSHKMKHGLDLVIVDHLGEVCDTGESDTSIISKAAANFRNIAKDLNIPVLLASQLNRKVEDRADKRPMMSDLKQSGKIEEAARMVWFLYRQSYYEGNDPSRRDLQLLVAKASHGRTGMLKLWCDLSKMYIRQWDQQDGAFPGEQNFGGNNGRNDY